MKNNKGISLMSLIVAVVILLLLSTVIISAGREAYRVIKLQNFISKMKIIQSKVDEIAEKSDEEIEKLMGEYGISQAVISKDRDIFENMVVKPAEYGIDINKSWDASDEKGDGNITNYYYFTPENLAKIGVKDINMTVIVNFKTRNVISKTGVTMDGKTYYRQYDIDSGEKLTN